MAGDEGACSGERPEVHIRGYPDYVLTDRHDYHQLLLGLDGDLELETAGRPMRVVSGVLAPIAAGDVHFYLSPGDNRVLVLDLPVGWCEALEVEGLVTGGVRRLPEALVQRGDSLRSGSSAEHIARWLSAALGAPNHRAVPPRLRLIRLLPAVRADLGRPWRVGEMASLCNLAEAAFARQFRALTGMSPHAWLMEQRLAQAIRLMRDSRASLTEIALACGFTDAPHFSHAFRRYRGVAPSEWRRERAG
jgi:AraC-like DNA-binding protein